MRTGTEDGRALRRIVIGCWLLGALLLLAFATVRAGDAPPKRKAVTDLGVRTTPYKMAIGELSKEEQAFFDELSAIEKTGKAPAPEKPEDGPDAVPTGVVAGVPKRALARAGGGSMQPPAQPATMGFGGLARKAVGVTTGGMQDIGQARKLLAAGTLPTPAMFSVEGFLSEHDIPLDGFPTGRGGLYASASLAWAKRYGKQEPEAVVPIGFGIEGMTLADVKRPPLNLCVVLDVSGSMNGGKIEEAKKALSRIVDRLNENDRLAIVLFDNAAWVLSPSAPVTDKAALQEQIKTIAPRGGTNIESGLKLGYQQVAAYLREAEKSPRVFLLTDARPNVGDTSAGGFRALMRGAAAKGIGLTAFGVGFDFGQKLAYEIFQTPGANYFFIENDKKIVKLFEAEFEFMVSPVAHGVTIQLVPAPGVTVTDVLGVPDYKTGAEGVTMKIPTLFLSKREGGGATMVALRVQAPPASEDRRIATVDLAFTPAGSDTTTHQSLAVHLPGGLDAEAATPYYAQPGARKALLLADAAVAMQAACQGQTAPTPDDAQWTPIRKGKVETRTAPPMPRGGQGITLTPAQAKAAAAGLGRFADWFATQLVGVDGVEPELRLMEQMEGILRKHAGLKPRAKRVLPETVQPVTAPPEIF